MEIESNKSLKKTAYYLGIVMVGVYLTIGFSLVFTQAFIELIPRNRVMYGCIVLLYAAFRLYMALRLNKKKNNTNNSN